MKKFKIRNLIMAASTVVMLSLVGCTKTEAQSWVEFKDVKAGYWAENAIYSAANNGMIKGYPDGTFKPNNHVKSVDFATMLIRSYGEEEKINPYPTGTLNYMKEMNYPHANKDNLISRTEVAELVAGTRGYNLSGVDAIKYLLVEGLAKGKEADPTVSSYAGEDMLTRAEAVVFIQRVMNSGTDSIQPNPKNPSDAKWIRDAYEKMLKDKGIQEKINYKNPSTNQLKNAIHNEMIKNGYKIDIHDNVSLGYTKNGSYVGYHNLNSGVQIDTDNRNADNKKALALILSHMGFTDTTTVNSLLDNEGVERYQNVILRVAHTDKGISILIDLKE